LKFFSSVRLDIRRTESLKVGGEVVGNHTRVRVVKNKVAPPFREAEFDIMYGEGISHLGELIDIGVQYDLVQKSGSWFSIGDERIGQGRDNAKNYLRDNPEAAEALEAAIRREAVKAQEEKARKRKPAAATAAAQPVDIAADDFDDEDELEV
jgi:recombination protein RecA